MKSIVIFLFLICLMAYPAQADITIESISCYPVISNFESLSQSNCTISLNVNGGNQVVIGEIQGLNLSSEMKISVSDMIEKISYEPLNQGATWEYISWIQDIPAEKPAYSFMISETKYFIVKKVQDGSYTAFSNPIRSSSLKLKFSIDEIDYSKIIGLGDIRSAASFYDEKGAWFANAQAISAGITGNDAPNADNFVGTYKDGIFHIADRTLFTAYTKSLIETDVQLAIMQDAVGLKTCWGVICNFQPPVCKDPACSKVLDLINVHNGNLKRLQDANVQMGYTSVTSGAIEKTTIKQIAYDKVILTVRASKFSVIIPSGKVSDTIKINIPEFVEGDGSRTGTVTFSNVGKGEGVFEVLASGATTKKITLEPGQEGTVELYFSNQTVGTYQGEIIVYETNTGQEVKQGFELNVLPPKNFIPNDITTENHVVLLNSNDGMSQAITDNCDGQVRRWNGTGYDCYEVSGLKTTIIPGQPGQKEQINYPAKETPLIEYFKYILYALVVIFLIVFVSKMSGGRSKKGVWGMVFLFAVIAASALMILSYWPQIQAKIDEYRVLLYLI